MKTLALLLSTLTFPVSPASVSSGAACKRCGPIIHRPRPRPRARVTVTLRAGGRVLPTVWVRGRRYVVGGRGVRYSISIRNNTPRRLEVVTSVDGRDVIDGRRASRSKRGYIVLPWATVNVDGYRLNKRQVAAFRFSSISSSYAARMGSWGRIGRVRVSVFEERRARPLLAIPRGRSWWGRLRRRFGRSPSPARESRGKAARKSTVWRSQSGAGMPYRYRHYGRRPHRDLGTRFGERRYSPVRSTSFHRASSWPVQTVLIRYNSCRALMGLGACPSGCCWLHRGRKYSQPPPGWRSW